MPLECHYIAVSLAYLSEGLRISLANILPLWLDNYMTKPPKYEQDDLKYQLQTATDTDLVMFSGASVPRCFKTHIIHPMWPADAILEIEIDQERGPIPTGLSARRLPDNQGRQSELVSYGELESAVLQTISMSDLLRELTAHAVGSVFAHQMLTAQLTDGEPLTSDLLTRRDALAKLVTMSVWDEVRPRRRKQLTVAHLHDVASVYRQALEQGDPPTIAVAEHFHVAHSTASKWIRKARDQGELGPARGTRAGEGQHE